jgi:hypothetical protein
MSEPSATTTDEEESDNQRLQETLDKMSIDELFELLIDTEAKIRHASNPPDRR